MPIYLVSVGQRPQPNKSTRSPQAKARFRHIAESHSLRHVDVADQ